MAEVEATLDRLSAHKSVKGVLVLNNANGKVIRHAGEILQDPSSGTGATADGAADRDGSDGDAVQDRSGTSTSTSDGGVYVSETARQYADVVNNIVSTSKLGIKNLDGQDNVRFLRIRTKKYELMITPEDKYTLVVFHDPTPSA